MKKNVYIVIVLFSVILVSVSYILSDFVSEHFKNDLDDSAVSKTKAAVQIAAPIINSAVRNSDDIVLIDRIQALAKLDCISSSFITDADGKTLINNDIAQINAVKTDKPYKTALSNRGELIQTLDDAQALFLYSYPLANGEMLFCVISAQADKSLIRFIQVKYFLISAIFIVCFALLLWLLSKLFILQPFDNLQKIIVQKADEDLTSAKSGAPKKSKSPIAKLLSPIKNFLSLNPREQYGDILNAFKKSSDENILTISALSENNESLSGLISYYCNKQVEIFSVLIILDSLNNVVFGFDKTGKILKKDFKKGENIVESVQTPEVLNIVNKAHETAGSSFEEQINGINITAFSIYTGIELSGAIISSK
ncbi:MAG: hypothetical protein LBN20_02385 [Endomicrobium sp.]|jgi:hypothetical protein|nr:hypothetical protein [Endomicrobium sp.]